MRREEKDYFFEPFDLDLDLLLPLSLSLTERPPKNIKNPTHPSELERHPEVFGLLPSTPRAFAAWSATLPTLAPVPPAPRTRKLIGMLGVIAAAVAVIATGYVSVGVAGYLAFPRTVQGNVLNSFGDGDGLMQVVRGVVGAFFVIFRNVFFFFLIFFSLKKKPKKNYIPQAASS